MYIVLKGAAYMNFQPRLSMVPVLSLLLGVVLLQSCGGGASKDINFGGTPSTTPTAGAGTPAPAPDVDPTPDAGGRSWTIAEVLSEPRRGGAGGEAKCGGEFGFARCVCAGNVRSSLRYRPSLTECNGNAAAILDGEYLDAFSIVVRDSQNRDRWPAAGSGFGGCSQSLADSESPPARCSAFKVQEKFPIANGTAIVHCFGASGYSDLFSDVVRVTIKNSDDPFSNDDDIDRLCLVSGSEPLN